MLYKRKHTDEANSGSFNICLLQNSVHSQSIFNKKKLYLVDYLFYTWGTGDDDAIWDDPISSRWSSFGPSKGFGSSFGSGFDFPSSGFVSFRNTECLISPYGKVSLISPIQ